MTPYAKDPSSRVSRLRRTLQFIRSPLAFFSDCAAGGEDIIHFRGSRRLYFLNHPDLIEHVLTRTNRLFLQINSTPASLTLREALGDGLLMSNGDLWRRQRRLMQPAFQPSAIAGYGETMVQCTRQMLDGWQEGELRNIHTDMMALALQMVSETLIGANMGDGGIRIAEGMDRGMDYFTRRVKLALLPFNVPLPGKRQFDEGIRELDEAVYSIIRNQRENGSAGSNGLLQRLLDARDEDGSRMSDRQLRDELVTLFLAGHETTAVALSWTLKLISTHPAVEERLLAEYAAVLAGRGARVEDLPHLPYTDWVIKEAMRLYPPVWRVGREVVEDCEVGGWAIPKGSLLVMSQWVMHRDVRYWDEPEKFRPERWGEDRVQSLLRYAYFPFGGGPRQCIGMNFALMEIALALATLLPRVHLSLAPGHPIRLQPSITLRPKGGIWVNVHRRS